MTDLHLASYALQEVEEEEERKERRRKRGEGNEGKESRGDGEERGREGKGVTRVSGKGRGEMRRGISFQATRWVG